MSNQLVHFTPRDELEPQAKIDSFVEFCRRLETLNAREQFHLNRLVIAYRKGHRNPVTATFITAEAAKRGDVEPILPQPFLDFAKSVIIYLKAKGHGDYVATRISALRFLEAALREWNKDARATAVTAEILDTAVELAFKDSSPPVAYRTAGQLRLIVELMQSLNFISFRIPWEPSVKKPPELGSKISKDALKERSEKLPSAAALRALGFIFHQASQSCDVIVSSFAALMCCAPERINEVLRLGRNAAVEGEREFLGHFGLRWPGSKGAYDTVKWIPSAMVPVAKKAMENLLITSARAQRIAAWYTKHPKMLYLHEDAEHLRNSEILTPTEIALIIFNDTNARVSANNWAKTTQKLEQLRLHGRKVGYYFKDVENTILSMLPATFPYMPGAPNLLCEESLAIAPTNEMHARRGTYVCMFSTVDYQSISNALTFHDGQPSIFKRFSYTEDDGADIEIKSHSLRHYLNTLAHMGGMSSAEIALFSGRKDEGQNKFYDHMTMEEVQAPITNAIQSGFMGNIVEKHEKRLIIRSQFSSIGASAAHTTEYGFCLHDFASEPCQIYRNCINCEEHECVKGKNHKERNIRSLKIETERCLKSAEEAFQASEYIDDTWIPLLKTKLDRINIILSIFDNPEIPNGARVRLTQEHLPLVSATSDLKPIKFKRRDRRKIEE